MPARRILIPLLAGLSISSIGVMENTPAQAGQLRAAFETAIRDDSTSPYIVLVTVVDDRTGESRTGCTGANLLLGAIYLEKWGSLDIDSKVPDEIKKRWKEVETIALQNTSRLFHFSDQAALDNIPFGYQEACSAIEQGSRARIDDRTGQVIFGPFVEGPSIVWGSCPLPDYPPETNAASESSPTISLLVGPDGSLKESKVSISSGSARRDESVRSALSACTFKPRTIDGEPAPEAAWMTARVGSRARWPGPPTSTPR